MESDGGCILEHMARAVRSRKWWNWKWWLVFTGVFLAACVLVGYKWNVIYQQNRLESHQFVGQIDSINDGEIQTLGYHVPDLDTAKSDYAHPQRVTVKVGPGTTFTKIIWRMISKEDLAKANGKIDPSTVEREQQAGSLDDLKSSEAVSITVKTEGDSLNDEVLTASEIDYNIQVYPTPATPKK